MKPAGTDPLPDSIRVVRGRRRSVELSLESGELVARVPSRMSRREIESTLVDLRQRLWQQLRRSKVFDDESLQNRARAVAKRLLSDIQLPSFEARFSRRQKKRWGSCTVSDQGGSILISHRLQGHPMWVLDHLLLHELIHLVAPHHGPRFQELMARCPQRERAEGYLEALELMDMLPSNPQAEPLAPVSKRVHRQLAPEASLPLFPDEPAE